MPYTRNMKILNYSNRTNTMKPLILFICLLLGFVPNGFGEKTLSLNTFAGPPLSNERQTGFYDLIIREGFKRIGIKINISHLPAERSLKNANSGIDDGDFVRISGLSRIYPNLLQVPEKITDFEFVVFTKNKTVAVKNWQSLYPYNVAIVRGWKILEENLASAVLFRVKNQNLLFNMLNKSRTDFVVYSKFEGLWIIKKKKYQEIRALSPPLAVREMFLYLHKKHKNLVHPLSETFKQMKRDGSFDEIAEKSLKPYTIGN